MFQVHLSILFDCLRIENIQYVFFSSSPSPYSIVPLPFSPLNILLFATHCVYSLMAESALGYVLSHRLTFSQKSSVTIDSLRLHCWDFVSADVENAVTSTMRSCLQLPWCGYNLRFHSIASGSLQSFCPIFHSVS